MACRKSAGKDGSDLHQLQMKLFLDGGPTKVGEHGNNIFVTLDWLQVDPGSSRQRDAFDGSGPVQISCSYVSLIISAPHRADTLTLDWPFW